MNESEYSRLFGSDVGSGRLPSANTFWGLLATSVGTDVEENRQRLLRAFETIPVELRTGYLRRLHSSTPSNAAGAWSELEFAALLQASRVEFVWIDAQEDSSHLRSLDFLLCERIHAEVTQFQENSVPDREMQLVRLVARGDLPTGTYTFTFGEGQPPVSKLRAALKSSPAGAPVEAVVGEWSIRQADQASPRTKVGDPTWMGDASGLIEKVKKAVRAKRRQARGAGARELVVSVVMLDRHARTLTDLLKENPSVLSEAIKSSGRVANELIVHGLVLGIVASDRFPPVPEWVVFAATDELLLRQLQAEYVGLPGGIQWP
jgi:hypothetical protein